MSERAKMYMKINEFSMIEKLIASLGDQIYISETAAEVLPRDFIDTGLASLANEMSKDDNFTYAVYEYEEKKIDVAFIFIVESNKVYVRLEDEEGLFNKFKNQ